MSLVFWRSQQWQALPKTGRHPDLHQARVSVSLDELASSIKAASADPVAAKLADLLLQWKLDDSNVEDLESLVEHYIGNSWIASEAEHKNIYGLWEKFRSETMRGIRGMTMNERLFCFCLMSRLDVAQTERERLEIHAKLLASP